MQHLRGQCHCGNITLQIALTGSPESYRPRACDCDFCRKHGAAYLSDPEGSLTIEVADADLGRRYRQGSGAAQMLLCGQCGVLVAALYEDAEDRLGAVNVRALRGAALGQPEPISPKTLTADQKIARWRRLWFRNVQVGRR